MGFSIPVIISGFLADRFGLIPTLSIFCVALAVITLVTVSLWKSRRVQLGI
ncbi:hypothetical protein [Breoghania sp.]|uniref:hypothetical protein n=1 Tax=Breoghania sp. TaxID=2065378 RepID=UPI0026020576|nr:hypothetical protein [Breoghania sp.]MDJ0930698.1 hypothetical protein [Breoghania sp.]